MITREGHSYKKYSYCGTRILGELTALELASAIINPEPCPKFSQLQSSVSFIGRNLVGKSMWIQVTSTCRINLFISLDEFVPQSMTYILRDS